VTVTLRTRDMNPPLQVMGATPDATCPLAVTLAHIYDHDTSRWHVHSLGGYYVTHRPTGWQLGGVRFGSVQEGLDVIERADWRFPAWAAANGGDRDPATLACKVKWRAATELG